jgi:selenophosphate synthase
LILIISLGDLIVQIFDQPHFDFGRIVAPEDIRDEFGLNGHADLSREARKVKYVRM